MLESASKSESAFLSICHLLLHAFLSFSSAFLTARLRLPSRLLHGLHTYIHPDSSSADGLRAAIRRPDSTSEHPHSRRSRHKPQFDESQAQLLRLRLADSHLPSRLYFPLFRSVSLSAAIALPNLALPLLPSISALAAAAAASHLLFSLSKLSFDRSASKRSEKQLSVLFGFLGFLIVLLIVFRLSPSVFAFDLGGSQIAGAVAAALAGGITGLLLVPASREARAFWLGTDQLRWNLSVVSCSAPARLLLYAAVLVNIFATFVWIDPIAGIFPVEFREFRVWALVAAAISQLMVLRSNVQMFLNEAVLCWYQWLHSSRVPDMNYARAKIFLHNHYICLVVLQFLAPPVLVLLLLGVSQLRGNLFTGLLFSVGRTEDCCSDVVKGMALFVAWWIVFAWSALTMINLALYRCGLISIS